MTLNMRNTRTAMDELYLSRDQYYDIEFIVGTERIRAHRSVLASASPKYKAQFYGLRPDKDEIHVPNVSAAAFKEFLQLFYKDYINLTCDNIEEILDLAKQSLVDQFVETCVRFIREKIIPQNVVEAYRLAILYDLKALRIRCEEKISSSTKIVFASDGFLQCSQDMLLQILKLDTFNCSELNVFNACMEWACEVCKRGGIDQKDTSNLRETLGNAVYQIRFGSMKITEFVELHSAWDSFFTHDEFKEIVYMIGQLKNFTSKSCNNDRRIQYTYPKVFPVQRMITNRFANKRNRTTVVISSDDDQ